MQLPPWEGAAGCKERGFGEDYLKAAPGLRRGTGSKGLMGWLSISRPPLTARVSHDLTLGLHRMPKLSQPRDKHKPPLRTAALHASRSLVRGISGSFVSEKTDRCRRTVCLLPLISSCHASKALCTSKSPKRFFQKHLPGKRLNILRLSSGQVLPTFNSSPASASAS